MYIFYSILLFLSLLIYIPLYYLRIGLLKNERLYLAERLGLKFPKANSQKTSLWIHAVSVGEVLSLQNLVTQIKSRHPDWIIHFSTLTNSGMRVAKEKLIDADNIFFVPLDFKKVVRRFFISLNPSLFILAESEFWPNLLREAGEQMKRVLLINGRISTRTLRRYSKIRFIVKRVLKNINFFLVQTEKDKENLERIGVDTARIEVAGNLKAEVNLQRFTESELLRLKKSLSIPERKRVIVAGSTRKGEEAKLLDAYTKARRIKENFLLILAPRHPERCKEVERVCQTFPFQVKRKSLVSPEAQWDILILDTIGELADFYALSDVAFVGGSLIPWGGHNLLEPAFYKKPIFFGPYMGNFSFFAKKFVQAGAARIVYKEEDLVEMFLDGNDKYLEEMGKKAGETLNSLQGATEKTLKAIEDLIAQA